jgi:hypothetical protein
MTEKIPKKSKSLIKVMSELYDCNYIYWLRTIKKLDDEHKIHLKRTFGNRVAWTQENIAILTQLFEEAGNDKV